MKPALREKSTNNMKINDSIMSRKKMRESAVKISKTTMKLVYPEEQTGYRKQLQTTTDTRQQKHKGLNTESLKR